MFFNQLKPAFIAAQVEPNTFKVRPHRTRSAAADRDRSPLRQTAFCVAGPLACPDLRVINTY